MTAWREAGLTYIKYSSIAAKILRKALKPELQVDAAKRTVSTIKLTPWVGGKAQKGVPTPE